jgi:hypothetical protein
LTFTDACARGDGVGYLAAAERSPHAIDDGEVVGVALGWIDGGDARWGIVREADGAPFLGKCEGLAWSNDPLDQGRARALIVVDRDDPDAPSELCTVDVDGLPAPA